MTKPTSTSSSSVGRGTTRSSIESISSQMSGGGEELYPRHLSPPKPLPQAAFSPTPILHTTTTTTTTTSGGKHGFPRAIITKHTVSSTQKIVPPTKQLPQQGHKKKQQYNKSATSTYDDTSDEDDAAEDTEEEDGEDVGEGNRNGAPSTTGAMVYLKQLKHMGKSPYLENAFSQAQLNTTQMVGEELQKLHHQLEEDGDNITVSTMKTTESDRKAALQYVSSLNQARHETRYGNLTKVIENTNTGEHYELQSGLSSGASSRKRIGKQVDPKWVAMKEATKLGEEERAYFMPPKTHVQVKLYPDILAHVFVPEEQMPDVPNAKEVAARKSRAEYNDQCGLHCDIDPTDLWAKYKYEINLSMLVQIPTEESHGLKAKTPEWDKEFSRIQLKGLFDLTGRASRLLG